MLKKSASFFLISLFLAGVSLNCRSHDGPVSTSRKSMLQKIYVEKVETAGVAAAKKSLKLKVVGNLPSPAYQFQRFDVKVKGRVIEITPLATYDANKVVTQVLVPFEEICTVDRLKPGSYEVKVYGRGKAVLAKQGVTVQE
ncbi:MAG: hypothetical protein D6743_03795 [Calditrichaeota bacterium]|nr:MAG: hypothetical protein D6743_03795 [Calditrichota bacterium]